QDGTPEPIQDDGVRSPLDLLIEKERWDHLNVLLQGFSAKDRIFLQLYYEQGLEPARVAEEMSISLKTVYSKKHKIRAHLRHAARTLAGDSAIADLVPVAA